MFIIRMYDYWDEDSYVIEVWDNIGSAEARVNNLSQRQIGQMYPNSFNIVKRELNKVCEDIYTD